MSKKITSMIALVLLFAVTCVPTQAVAAVSSEMQQTIPASGTLVLTSVLTVTGGPLTFNANHNDLSVTAPETITVNFDGAQAAFQSIVVSCSNPEYQLGIGSVVVEVDPKYFRPTEVDLLLGDPTKAETKLGWSGEYKLEELVNDMMESDLKLMTKDVYLQDGGYKIMSYFE